LQAAQMVQVCVSPVRSLPRHLECAALLFVDRLPLHLFCT
jgi:hypothetical protein